MSSNTDSSPLGFFYKLSETKQHLIALTILFLVPFFMFTEITIGGKELQRHDTTQFRAGVESVYEYREEFNEDPLWVENMFMGMPAYVVSVQKVVPHIDVFYNILKPIFPAFQHWVMLSGMYVLLVMMGFSPLIALFGSFAFSLTSYLPIIIGAGHNTKFATLAFAPWIIAGYWKISRSHNLFAGLLLFTVAMTLNVRALHPQITYYFMFLLGFLWISDSWVQLKQKEYKAFATITLLLIVGGIVGILGYAQQFLTLQEYAEYSIRGGSALDNTSGLSTGYAFAWSQGIKETLTLFVAELYGGASPTYFGPKSFTSGPHYLGALLLPFIIVALLKNRSRTMLVFLFTGILAMFFSWGSNFALLNEAAFDLIPYFNKFRAPETWLILTAFCFTVVAVYGLQWTVDTIKEHKDSFKKLYPALGITLGVFLLLFVQVKTMDYTKDGEIDNIANQIAQQNQINPNNPQVRQQAAQYVQANIVPDREAAANRDVLRTGFFLLIGGAILFLMSNRKISLSIGLLALLITLGADLITVGKRYIPERQIVNKNINTERYIESQKRDIDQYIIDNVSNGVYEERVFPLLDGAFQNAIPSYFYPTIGGYTGAKLSIVADLQQNGGPLYKGNGGLNLPLLGALNIRYITYQPGLNIEGLTQVYQGNQGAVYENEYLLARAYFVDSLVVANSPQEAFNFVDQPKVDYSKVAVVEGISSSEIQTSSDSLSSVEFIQYNGANMELNVSRSTPGFLVLSEIYYPAGWKAYLNDEEVDIHKTNYVLRGIQIPAGNHTLKLEFKPTSYELGVTLSWASILIQLGLALFLGITYFRGKNKAIES
jgi:hypothetical protein